MLLGVSDNFRVSLDHSSGHLADPSCTAVHKVNGTVWYEVPSQAGVCGNVLRVRTEDLVHLEAIL